MPTCKLAGGLKDELFKVFPHSKRFKDYFLLVSFVQRFGDLISIPTNRVREWQEVKERKELTWKMRLYLMRYFVCIYAIFNIRVLITSGFSLTAQWLYEM